MAHEVGDLNLSQRQDLGRPSWTFGPSAVWVGQGEHNSRIMGSTKTGGLGAASLELWCCVNAVAPTTSGMPQIWATKAHQYLRLITRYG